MEDLSGKTLGRYQVIEPLGEGGMAAVYKAYQPGMERYVALKILPQAFARDPEFTGRFEQEAKVIAKLQHPHILPVHDYGEAESYTYIVMPLVESGTLADLLKGKPPLPLQRIRQITAQVGDALDYAHSKQVVHRDVKPSNILIDSRGNCLLTDFGIAKMVKGTKHFTQTGGILGTPHYMSPEQGSGGELTRASDIYSLGVVIYEMATGRVPFDAETPMAVVIKHMTDPLPPPSKLNPSLYPGLEGVILKAMAKEPGERYDTAGDLVRAIKLAIPERTLLPEEHQIETVPAPELVEREQAASGLHELEAPAEPEPEVPSQPMYAPEPKRRRTVTPWIIGAAVILLGLCGVGAVGAYQLISVNSNALATENAEVTQRAETEDQMTAVAADQIRTATAEARLAEVTDEPTATEPAAVAVEAPPLRDASPGDLLGAHWPALISDGFDDNGNQWNPFQDFTDEYGTRSFYLTDGKYRWEMLPERDVNVHDNPEVAPFTDFYLSVEVQQLEGPDTADYGVVFRRMSSSSFYSFSLSDDRQYSLQRLQDGGWTTILEWTETDIIQPGEVNRITVVAQGDQFTFFINDQYVDSAVDAELKQGVAGIVVDLFDAGVPATWEFDNFEVRTPWTASYVDSFESDTGLWRTGSSSGRDVSEELTIGQGVYRWLVDCENEEFGCISSTYLEGDQRATDFELSVDARQLDGPSQAEYGLRFRDDGDNYFEFLISESGTFSILLWYDQEIEFYYFERPAPMIEPGGTHRLTVAAEGSSFSFYINDLLVGEVVEDKLPAGTFALSASLTSADQARFEFDNFQIRTP